MRKALILLVLLFAIGVAILAPSQAQVNDRHNPCVRRCRQEFKSAREACRHLPPAEKRECERRAKERSRACAAGCR